MIETRRCKASGVGWKPVTRVVSGPRPRPPLRCGRSTICLCTYQMKRFLDAKQAACSLILVAETSDIAEAKIEAAFLPLRRTIQMETKQ